MERKELPKLKKAVITLKKLDLLREVLNSENRSERNKENADILEEGEDPSSESVSTGSGESNVVGTDDDDLEKKIQAFSIPIKKESENINSKNENTCIKISNVRSVFVEKGGESSKPGKKVTFSFSKVDSKEKAVSMRAEVRLSSETKNAGTLESERVCSGTRRKKERLNKNKKSDGEEKQISMGNVLSNTDQIQQNVLNINLPVVKSLDEPSEHNLRNEIPEKFNDERSTGRKKRKNDQDSQENCKRGSDIFQKKKARKDETLPVPTKKVFVGRKYPNSSGKPSSSTLVKKGIQKNEEEKPKADTTKKAKLVVRSSSASSDNHSKITRSTRTSCISSSSKAKNVKNKTSGSKEQNISGKTSQTNAIEFKDTPEKLHKSKEEAKRKHMKVKDRINSSLKVDNNILGLKIRERSVETRSKIKMKKKHNHDPVIPKKDKVQQSRQKVICLRNNSSKTNVPKGKRKVPRIQTHSSDKKSAQKVTKVETPDSDVLDDGEELFEKICDILEDSSRILEFSVKEKRKSVSPELLSYTPKAVSSSKEIIFSHYSSLFKPKLLQKYSRFPSDSKGTIPYQKLWKWSHYVKMPSDMWSLHKHPNGNFVIVFHISEMSPFPNLIIDKCVLFKETASPCVKIYGKDVLALSSENELQTLGNVCSFLKHIHALSLCEGKLSQATEETSKNCELYIDRKVSLPYKCKSCQ